MNACRNRHGSSSPDLGLCLSRPVVTVGQGEARLVPIVFRGGRGARPVASTATTSRTRALAEPSAYRPAAMDSRVRARSRLIGLSISDVAVCRGLARPDDIDSYSLVQPSAIDVVETTEILVELRQPLVILGL